MTDLNLSLIGAGAFFIVLIFIYNKWQEYRARKSVDQVFSSKHDDVLMKSNEESHIDVQRQEQHCYDAEKNFYGAEESEAHEQHNEDRKEVRQELTTLSVDELIDCVVPMEFDSPQSGEKLLSEIGKLRFVGKKPVHFIGINQDGEKEEITFAGVYSTIFSGVQMVNRSGPLNELEYSEFVGQLREIADKLTAFSDIPDMNRVMETSRELHQFVAEHDAQLSVNVMSNGAPWDIATLLSALEKQGFDIRPDGKLIMSDGDTGSLFTLSTNVSASETVTGKLTLLLDVPCVAPSLNAFGAMSACAKSLATRLGGVVVDDSHRPISIEAINEIAGQVAEFYSAMEEAQIPAGSRRAQRLFS